MNGKQLRSIAKCDEASRFAEIDPSSLSELISLIYDCAIAPDNWEHTLRSICEKGNFCCATINLQDRENRLILIQQSTGAPTSWIKRYHAHMDLYGAEIRSIRSMYSDSLPVDEPKVWSRHVPREAYIDTQLFKEWLNPQGIIDVMQLLIMRHSTRYGAISFGRHKRTGPFNDSEMALASLLQPHLRRALTISNMLEIQTLRANNLRSAIENLSTGILLLAEDGTILEANPAAERIIERCPVAYTIDGRLGTEDRAQAERLRLSLVSATKGEASVMSTPVACGSADGIAITSYILPLAGSGLRHGLHETAVAAMFITPDEDLHAQQSKAEILGVVYNLTAAEKRVAEALADGKTSLQAAEMLGVSEATVRSHLTRIFDKTGVTRQAELIALMYRLAPPLRDANKTQIR